VLAMTAPGDVQPSAWLAAWVAAAIRSGAGVTLPAGPPSSVRCPWARACVVAACTGNGRNSALSSTRPYTSPRTASE
jgi:hypothetical protein